MGRVYNAMHTHMDDLICKWHAHLQPVGEEADPQTPPQQAADAVRREDVLGRLLCVTGMVSRPGIEKNYVDCSCFDVCMEQRGTDLPGGRRPRPRWPACTPSPPSGCWRARLRRSSLRVCVKRGNRFNSHKIITGCA